MTDWIDIHRGDAPLVVAFPHAGTEIPAELEGRFVSKWLALRDADWWIDELYAFARDLGATTVRTRISRSVIDANRDPSGRSLYPGQATTGLCPTTDFDGNPLYSGAEPDDAEIKRRRIAYFEPYHAAIKQEIDRLQQSNGKVVLYDAHSIRSNIPRLFDGELPVFNLGTYNGSSCHFGLAQAIADICAAHGPSYIVNGRFKGGWTTRHYGRPANGVHAVQMELALRSYVAEPDKPTPENWPAPFDPDRAAAVTATLREILSACIAFARKG